MTGFGTQPKTRSSEKEEKSGDGNYITELSEPKPSSYIHLNMSSVSNEDYTHTAK